MALSPSQRVTLIKEVAERLSFEEWPLIDLTLTQFGLPTSAAWNRSTVGYVLKMAEGASDQLLIDLAQHVNQGLFELILHFGEGGCFEYF